MVLELKDILHEIKDDVKAMRVDLITVRERVSRLEVKSAYWGAIGAIIVLLPGVVIYWLSKI